MSRITYTDWLHEVSRMENRTLVPYLRAFFRDKKNLDYFGRYFFPEQIQFQECIAEPHKAFLDEMHNPRSSALIMPRGHAKTTWARVDIIHDIVNNLEPFLVLIGPTMTDAQMSFSYVKGQLETNERLRTVYGDLVPPITPKRRRRWSDKHFETANGVVCIARQAGKGRGLNIGGRRPTKVLLDDMEDKEKVKSELQRRKLDDWFYQVIIPMMDRERGRFKMIGTVLHYSALVLKVYGEFGGIRRAAIEDAQGRASMDGEPIWFSREELESVRRKIGSFAFAQEYMNDPRTDENSDVKLAWIRRRNSIKLKDKQGNMLWKIFSALDPAISQQKTADDTAIVTIARLIVSDEVKIVVLNASHGVWPMSRILTEAKRVWDRYPHERFGVENVAYQESLRQLLSKNKMYAVAVNPKSKDKRTRLLSIVGLIEFGNIEFMGGCEDLIEQLTQFPNGQKDDLVDAFVYAVELALKMSGGFIYAAIE